MHSVGTPSLWLGFAIFVLAMLALDLGVFHRKTHAIGLREALLWSAVWVTLSGVFGLGIWHWFGSDRALEFATGYLIEKSLSVDNLFVFVLLFAAFRIPARFQHRVLFWGVLGALLMRGVFIGLGAALLQRFHWVLYVFGVILLASAVKLWREQGKPSDPKAGLAHRLFQRACPSTPELHDRHFWVKLDGRWLATPLFAVLVVVELTDVVFAVDSIPAIFAVSDDPFIVYTSNIFAIFGLRSLYFLLAGALERFYLLKPALAVVLALVGLKLLVSNLYKVPIGISLAVIGALLTGAIVGSWLWPKKRGAGEPALDDAGPPDPGHLEDSGKFGLPSRP
ncbi:MAG TPA: TerC family protein [Polyangiaceae bacterium]|nr:TerC family protein [Polyangiaceae bacterium]